MTSVNLGPLTITADFDSGNFLRAELVDCPSPIPSVKAPLRPSQPGPSQLVGVKSSGSQQSQDFEVNIWTKPDCHGTVFENANRTWFYFGIKGGTPNAMVKINILNLNKQTKLFMQGMAPVCRILPEKPSWERVKDKISINENKSTENVCSISFRQRLPDNPEKSTLYIAFTYPLSYLEMCDSLKKLDQYYKVPTSTLSQSSIPKRRELWMPQGTENEIYYHRECVCYSLEEKRVELLTISSISGISDQREARLSKLFPVEEEPRPFTFPGKKVVFLSARVHPGETPSSFVLNGFLKFILDKSDPRAVILRRLFVFKIIPILNPDGVYKGHYRTDPRGVNLNRMYLNPSPVLHPSIYAARKLLMFYHNGLDAPDDFEELAENEMLDKELAANEGKLGVDEDSLSCQSESTCQMKCERSSSISEDSKMLVDEATSNPKKVEKKPYTFVLSDANSLCAGCGPFEDDNARSCHDDDVNPQQAGSSSVDATVSNVHQCAFESCDDDSVCYENLKLFDTANNNMEVDQGQQSVLPTSPSATKKAAGRPSSPRRKKKGSPKSKKKGPKTSSLTEIGKQAKLGGGTKVVIDESLFSGIKKPPGLEHISTRFTRSRAGPGTKTNSRYYDSSSGLFLYVDMHGHTTKRGIFMYGNHFSDFQTQAECMLVPRLMAINSPHFDFAACNFTERLMCVKDRRDGASREGSGRVACLKLTGLIRSYTLECNYNTGRLVNQVVSRPASYGFSDPGELTSFHPPKYTIELFEAIGKSLAETLLDMTGHNPWSRLTLTEFKTLDGVKRSLVSRLKLSAEYKGSSTDISTKKSSSQFETNSLLQSPPTIRVLKKPKSKVLVQSQPGGPLGPRRENQNPPANAKPSGSRAKKLPITERSDGPLALPTSSASKTLDKSTLLPKSSLTKVMKKKSFPKFASSKIRKTKRKQTPDNSDKLPN